MDWRIFASTFVLIFLAELGDKTQLAALAATAGSKSTWSVFVGASLALVLSTLIAVLVGEGLQRVIPPVYIRIAAGCLFLVFGALLLASTLRAAPEEEVALQPEARPGFVARLAIEAAVGFEKTALATYEQMARAAEDEGAKEALTFLINEEKAHLAHLGTLVEKHGETALGVAELPDQPPAGALTRASPGGHELLQQAAEHEEMAARFFGELSRQSTIPSLRAAFAALSQDEAEHAKQLRTLLENV